jgi:hypothetical protein
MISHMGSTPVMTREEALQAFRQIVMQTGDIFVNRNDGVQEIVNPLNDDSHGLIRDGTIVYGATPFGSSK